MISALEATLAAVNTQHALSTQVVEIFDGEMEARTLSYFTATLFGVGPYFGEVCWLKIGPLSACNFAVLWLRPSAT